MAEFQPKSCCLIWCPSCPQLPGAAAELVLGRRALAPRRGRRDRAMAKRTKQDRPFQAFVASCITQQDADKEGGERLILPSDGVKLA